MKEEIKNTFMRRFSSSIRFKLILSTSLVVFIIYLISSMIINYRAGNIIVSNLEQVMVGNAEKTAAEAFLVLQEGIDTVTIISHNPVIIDYMEKADTRAKVMAIPEYRTAYETFKMIMDNNLKLTGAYVGVDRSSYVVDGTGWINPPDYIMQERGWYKAVKTTHKLVISEAYRDATTGKMVVTIACPVFGKNNDYLGAAGVDLAIDDIAGIMKRFKFLKSGYAFLIDHTGLMLSHPDAKKILSFRMSDDASLERVGKRMIAGEHATSKYTFEGMEKYIGFAPVPVSGWSVGVAVPAVEVERELRTFKIIFAAVMIAFILIIIVSLNFLIGGTLKDIPEILRSFSKASEGNLAVDIPQRTKDEIGKIVGGFNLMLGKQREYLSKVLEASVRVRDTSASISDGNQNLAKRTQKQSSSISEVAATIEEINASIAQASSNSGKAMEVSQKTLCAVKEGEKVIEETITSMKEITASSSKIADIIKVVNDITFQTNLLALNAAVEAARAGEEGRGFAVVAGEVRNLAGRTAESSKQIDTLIKESLVLVQKGNDLAQQSGVMLSEIVNNTELSSEVIREIAGTLKEQSSAIDQIQTAVNQLSQVTHENSQMVDEMVESSGLLNSESDKLSGIVSAFKLR